MQVWCSVAGRKLTAKEERFCREYIIDLNATQAAKRAGYSEKSAYSIGQENLKKPEIESFIHQLLSKRAKRLEIKADNVLNEISRLAFSDITDAVEWKSDGTVTIKSSDTLSPDVTACIAEITQTTSGGKSTLKIKMHSKPAALDKLCRHLALYKERSPLEVLLDALPAEFAQQLREALAKSVFQGGSLQGSSEGDKD